ncbi:hypothetical protein A3K48_05590 [candidate division WOR-1 bacterium RIFOXYA12_FULL_52_29]|uniref:RNA-binding protein n=1 Tax=candidate division WOR-1 bacterium RIFOXYC12_FULL_54_18 TaxID=1802584 RepID=A0A1F4T732_UNCSA|nr:MAG: hypothetical protein A3K44_05590 [candidate division WOR-1 bacterium RIFOXYA2_FULL_51_19]OGC18009.1 MAG: hypothetical protein A3K48_05590 [candidate division WOR-1 bacterium RIFOXYA12_FULL_52_29]OGC26865.1 MAG: hypothetical protein A3K32_05585 [candidate division WOR-1 bacterium RIFOXYB2_FULL_45_9]OGC28426.1 MAG: hypothetical protein A3K49_05590 [candidate division WOR-1 bacterium RIFOXYC12_FULL_54_18]OGC31119.1 MAG: hypothetical protein A2346_07030 [candidate division WOR-1 bacterium R
MPEQVGKIFQKGDFAWVIKSCSLLGIWEKIIDERARKHTEPVCIRNRVLHVSTTTSTWAYELSFLKSQIVSKFNEYAGEEAILDIRFKSSGGVNG